MTTQVLFVQGGRSNVHDEWDNKLVESLERHLPADYDVLYPRMPDEANPQYNLWKAALIQEIDMLEDGAILVGHSLGGAFLINTLAEYSSRLELGGIFLIAAPFIGEGGWPSDDIETRDLSRGLPTHVPLYLVQGSEDDTVPAAHLELYERAIPRAIARRLAGRDHQMNNDLEEVANDIRSLR
jgi:predicted alpha/beta hydrolase family esterase